MNIEEYIASGILELYVYGGLNKEEKSEVQQMIKQHPEVKKEVEAIEKAVIRLSSGTAPYLRAINYELIKNKIFQDHKKVVPIKSNRWRTYVGWAASIVLLVTSYTFYNKYKQSESTIEVVRTERDNILEENKTITNKNKEYNTILNFIRERNTDFIKLGGQEVSPDSYAQVYWNKESNKVVIDASGLPAPPKGKVYQVWSLKLDPLTPTSIGLLESFEDNKAKLFNVESVKDADAFGITLEPAGGSKTPTLEQLYTLGKI
ncbi:Anti-sigma-K factor rskA [Zhouia amylolytica]|uniref:Anti-sigma-K factor rskA n=1 Tax=Zhouia amylolytica TaxID=376730 RepID=A0A1I6QKG1_9FLAO|nr:anti-sigma factor [Zhouia amylolytica]SFS52963.1 Anti-sigma-K factor rskA [Zhouia amylolytica]